MERPIPSEGSSQLILTVFVTVILIDTARSARRRAVSSDSSGTIKRITHVNAKLPCGESAWKHLGTDKHSIGKHKAMLASNTLKQLIGPLNKQ